MSNLFSLGFWFSSRPGALSPIGQNIFNVILIALVALLITSLIYKKKKGSFKYLWKRLFNFSFLNLFLFLLYFFFIYELVAFFSARFWFIILAAEVGVWVYFIIKDVKKIPILKKETERKKEFEKYLP